MRTILLVNGPNLGRLGSRKPEVYGHKTLADIEAEIGALAQEHGWDLQSFHSNHEGAIIDFLEANRSATAMVANPGALMMNGWALRDALEDFPAPWIEVHISNVWARDSFRHQSILSPVAHGVIAGLGTDGYVAAASLLIRRHHVFKRS